VLSCLAFSITYGLILPRRCRLRQLYDFGRAKGTRVDGRGYIYKLSPFILASRRPPCLVPTTQPQSPPMQGNYYQLFALAGPLVRMRQRELVSTKDSASDERPLFDIH